MKWCYIVTLVLNIVTKNQRFGLNSEGIGSSLCGLLAMLLYMEAHNLHVTYTTLIYQHACCAHE